jgi:hypothetical protein
VSIEGHGISGGAIFKGMAQLGYCGSETLVAHDVSTIAKTCFWAMRVLLHGTTHFDRIEDTDEAMGHTKIHEFFLSQTIKMVASKLKTPYRHRMHEE